MSRPARTGRETSQRTCSVREHPSQFLQSFVQGRNATIELKFVHRLQQCADLWSRVNTFGQHMSTHQQRRRWLMLDAQRSRAFEKPVHGRTVERSRPAVIVGLGKSREQFRINFLRQPSERPITHRRWCLEEHARFEVVGDDPEHGATHVVPVE